jgi:hypothetical protein
VAGALSTSANAVKALLQRARVALRKARLRGDVDVQVDRAVVEQFAAAIEAGSVERLTALLAEDAWGVTDGGGVVRTSTKPNLGRRAVARQWQNGQRRLNGLRVTATIIPLNGEPSIVIRLADAPDVVVAVVHLETREGQVSSLRVSRDPRRTAMFVGARATVHQWADA